MKSLQTLVLAASLCAVSVTAKALDEAWSAAYPVPYGFFAYRAQSVAWGFNQYYYVTGTHPAPGGQTAIVTLRYNIWGQGMTVFDPIITKHSRGEINIADNVAYVSGNEPVGPGERQEFFTAKYDSSGHIDWKQVYDDGWSHKYLAATTRDGYGNFYLTGRSKYMEQVCPGPCEEFYYTLKHDKHGNLLWKKFYGNGELENRPAAIAVDGSGNVHVTGTTLRNGSRDFLTVKYDSSGTELWDESFDSIFHDKDTAVGIALDSSGGVYVLGTSERGADELDYMLVKFDASGTFQWRRYFGGAGDDKARAIAIDSNDNVWITGENRNGSGTSRTIYTAVVDPNGGMPWGPKHFDLSGTREAASSIVIDDYRGLVYISGRSDNTSGFSSMATVVYSTSGFNELDSALFQNSNTAPDDYTYLNLETLALDNYGHIYVSGPAIHKEGNADFADYVTVKYEHGKYTFSNWAALDSSIIKLFTMSGSQENESIQGSFVLARARDPDLFPERDTFVVLQMDLETESGRRLTLKRPRFDEDPTLAATGLGGSYIASSREKGDAEAWITLSSEGIPLSKGFQGFCLQPVARDDRGFHKENPHETRLDLGTGDGMTLYEYRVDSRGELELRPIGLMKLSAVEVPQTAKPREKSSTCRVIDLSSESDGKSARLSWKLEGDCECNRIEVRDDAGKVLAQLSGKATAAEVACVEGGLFVVCLDADGMEIARDACESGCGTNECGLGGLTCMPAEDDDSMVLRWGIGDADKCGFEEILVREESGEVLRVLPPVATSAELSRDELQESGRLEVVCVTREGDELESVSCAYEQPR